MKKVNRNPNMEKLMGLQKKDIKTGKLSKKWLIDYRFNGRRIREPISTSKREAEKVLHQRLHSINENRHPILRKVIPLNNSMKEVFYKLHYSRNGNRLSINIL